MGIWMPWLLLISCLYDVTSAFTCFYFSAPDFSGQDLMIQIEREKHCEIPRTAKNGEFVDCQGNDTAARVNDTHVVLKTNEEQRSDMIILNYGRDNEPGKSTFSYDAACPAVPQVTEPPPDKDRMHFIAPVILFAIFTIIASFLYYNKCKKKSHNGPTVQAVPLKLILNGNSTNNQREAQ